MILLIAEYCPPEKRHIVSVFKLIQDLMAPSKIKGRNQFQLLMAKLPDDHKAKWFAGAALNTAEQSMAVGTFHGTVPTEYLFGFGAGTDTLF